MFTITKGEDDETNPRRYGKSLAEWIRSRFLANGLPVEDVIPEDWGWCVIVQSKPFLLWIGCGNDLTRESRSPGEDGDSWANFSWMAFVGYDLFPWNVSFWRRSKVRNDTARD
jgi:hypothetical protein